MKCDRCHNEIDVILPKMIDGKMLCTKCAAEFKKWMRGATLCKGGKTCSWSVGDE